MPMKNPKTLHLQQPSQMSRQAKGSQQFLGHRVRGLARLSKQVVRLGWVGIQILRLMAEDFRFRGRGFEV